MRNGTPLLLEEIENVDEPSAPVIGIGKNGCSYTCQATLSSIWLGFWMAE